MRKTLTLAAIFAVLAYVKIGLRAYAGEIVDAPGGGVSNPIPADYGGVEIATNSFYVGLTTVPTEVSGQGIGYRKFNQSTTTVNNVYSQLRWRVYGAIFSTAVCSNNDFMSIHVSSAGARTSREVTRIYNSVDISTVATGKGCGGYITFRYPLRLYGNLFYGINTPDAGGGSSANAYNSANLLYWLEP